MKNEKSLGLDGYTAEKWIDLGIFVLRSIKYGYENGSIFNHTKTRRHNMLAKTRR